jgi:hypothetical protein
VSYNPHNTLQIDVVAVSSVLHALQIRAEQDAYLAQLENEGQLEGIYGKGVQTIQSEPGIAIKTKTADGAVRVYINVCTCCKVWGVFNID